MDVSVRQGGQAVRGLVAGDFDVFDNGVRQQIDFVASERTPVNVVVALDLSGSVRGERLSQLRGAGARLVAMLAPEESAAIVTFTELVSITSRFTADRVRLTAALEEPAEGADTALFDATHAAIVLGASQSGRSLVIVFSDGTDTASFLSAEHVLHTARRTGPVVYAVTSLKEDRDNFFGDLVRLTGGRRLEVASLDRLSDAFEEILNESRDRYLLSYTPTGVSSGGWHEIDVRVRGRRADIRARPGYLASP
jgi:VWFA-related protein